jgi:hypothetical protein
VLPVHFAVAKTMAESAVKKISIALTSWVASSFVTLAERSARFGESRRVVSAWHMLIKME